MEGQPWPALPIPTFPPKVPMNLATQSEAQRLQALELYRIADQAADAALDELSRMAAQICGTPIGMVTLVHSETIEFRSTYGMERGVIPREIGFCAHTILGDETLFITEKKVEKSVASSPPTHWLVSGFEAVRK